MGALYRADPSSGDCIQLRDFFCSIVNITEDCIFYNTKKDDWLHKMSKDGLEDDQILRGNIGGVHILKDKLLFRRITQTNSSYPVGVYTANFDGSNEVLVFSNH